MRIYETPWTHFSKDLHQNIKNFNLRILPDNILLSWINYWAQIFKNLHAKNGNRKNALTNKNGKLTENKKILNFCPKIKRKSKRWPKFTNLKTENVTENKNCEILSPQKKFWQQKNFLEKALKNKKPENDKKERNFDLRQKRKTKKLNS